MRNEITTIPETFKIGSLEHEVTYEKGMVLNMGNWSQGLGNTGVIRIAEEIPLTLKKEQVFLRLFALCGDFVDGPAVALANRPIMGRQLFGLIRDNPQVIDVEKSIWDIPQIRFLGKQYKVYRRPSVLDHLATLNNGLMLIDVSEIAKLDLQWIAFYHELLHLIRTHIGQDVRDHDGDEAEEERIVDGYAFMLTTLLGSNDMTWVLESEDEAHDVYTPVTPIV